MVFISQNYNNKQKNKKYLKEIEKSIFYITKYNSFFITLNFKD